MGKDQRLNAQNQLLKAEKLYRAKQFKKAGKNFHSAGTTYLMLKEYEIARDCFLDGAKSFIEWEKFDTVLELYRLAGQASLLGNDYLDANQIYRDATNYISNVRNSGDRNFNYLLFSVLSYFCLSVNGQQKEALEYLKRIQKKVDGDYFKEHPLIKLVTNLALAIRDKNTKNLDRVKEIIKNFKFRDAELKLAKEVLILATFKIIIITTFHLDKEIYTTNDIINLVLSLDTSPLLNISKDSYYDFEIEDFKILKLNMDLSDNLALSKKPNLPLSIEVGKNNDLNFNIKPHFQLDKPYIGPAYFTCEINNKLIFIYQTESVEPNLISPLPTLNISIKNLRPPLIGQTFPLEILVENQSSGEALDVKLEVEFPEQLKVMRGTLNKQIYSLRSNEDLRWEININPFEAGDYIIKINMKFKDQDQNLIEEVKEFPFSIKL